MTSIVDTMRSFLSNGTAGPDVWVAIAWSVGILIVAYVASLVVYRRRTI